MAEMGMLDMLRQARDLQKRMSKVQKKVEKQRITASSGGGMVNVEITGKLEVRKVEIEQALIDRGDTRMLCDLVAAAVNSAITKAQEMVAAEMKEVTGGLDIPGIS